MRAMFHAELDELMIDLARMARLAARMITNASIALHQTDLAFADLVIANGDRMNAMHDDTERCCISLLALQARHLISILFADSWSHSVERAVDAALIGRYYERFGDHAVSIARQVCFAATGWVPKGHRPSGARTLLQNRRDASLGTPVSPSQ